MTVNETELDTAEKVLEHAFAELPWWRARRAEEHPDIATNSRRLNTLAKLAAKGLEAI